MGVPPTVILGTGLAGPISSVNALTDRKSAQERAKSHPFYLGIIYMSNQKITKKPKYSSYEDLITYQAFDQCYEEADIESLAIEAFVSLQKLDEAVKYQLRKNIPDYREGFHQEHLEILRQILERNNPLFLDEAHKSHVSKETEDRTALSSFVYQMCRLSKWWKDCFRSYDS